jgi:hypothetical protein
MEFAMLGVVLLFIIPFPAKWKFVWYIRFFGLAILTLISGLMLLPNFGLNGRVGGGALILASLIFFYLSFPRQWRIQRARNGKKV